MKTEIQHCNWMKGNVNRNVHSWITENKIKFLNLLELNVRPLLGLTTEKEDQWHPQISLWDPRLKTLHKLHALHKITKCMKSINTQFCCFYTQNLIQSSNKGVYPLLSSIYYPNSAQSCWSDSSQDNWRNQTIKQIECLYLKCIGTILIIS